LLKESLNSGVTIADVAASLGNKAGAKADDHKFEELLQQEDGDDANTDNGSVN
jgi:hypothetical protein